ncbi:hypothetical protein NUV30_03840 [Kocuria rhizophila]|nr:MULTISPECIES: hypothetical protein [Kocuria]MCR4525513.1 hypothetical protein [Kocuria rhizophila]MDA4827601.1 hypothetical protein [Kocuria rhizophila]MDN3461402.1 hypothetical protein [Kocuria sp. APC 4018]WSQ03974.1 hypothetical protein OG312_05995 [Kocuria rhizophila]WSY87938.1 hypothetical protein OH783_09805 [Kocuria rhizophila]
MKSRIAALVALTGLTVAAVKSWRDAEAKRDAWNSAVDPVD